MLSSYRNPSHFLGFDRSIFRDSTDNHTDYLREERMALHHDERSHTPGPLFIMLIVAREQIVRTR